MAENITITANWSDGSLSNGMISRQYDNNRYRVQFINYPVGDNEELTLHLIVWMKTEENGQQVEQDPIELETDQWIITNFYTQFVQGIKFQLCVRNEEGTFEAHSPIFTASISNSLRHDGTHQDVYVNPLFDPYKDYVDELIIGAGATVIDSDLDTAGAAADAKATGDAITDLNERLVQLDDAVLEKIVNAKSGTYNATAGTSIPSATHLVDISIPEGTAFKFVLHADGILSKYNLYANGAALKYNLTPETEYDFIAASDITWISVYTTAANVIGSGTMTGVVFVTTVNDGSLQTQVKGVGVESAISMFSISSDDLEAGAIRNGTGEDFSALSRIRTKAYIPVKSGTVISSNFSFNVWEYDYPGKIYIRDGGQWLNSYTVVNDCYIRIMWNSTYNGSVKTAAELLAGTVISSLTQVGNAFYDTTHVNYIGEISSKAIDNLFATAVPSHTVRSIAHRGDDIDGPQCTAPAYILARKRGFTVAENDLWLSEDGEFVMWHDTNLAKLGNMVDINGYLMYTDGTNYYWVHPTTNAVYTWNGSDYVASSVSLSGLDRCNGTNYGVNSQYSVTGLPLSVLKRIDFGVYKGAKFAGTQILTFAEWVLLCKQLGMEIYIDRKLTYTTELVTQAANIVKRYGMGDYASWLGLNLNQINHLRSIIPDSRCGILQHPTAATAQSYQPYNIGRGFFFNGDAKNGMTSEAIQYGLDAGFDVEVWYVDVPTLTAEQVYETIRTAVSYGVTGMTLDHYRVNDAFKSLLDEY